MDEKIITIEIDGQTYEFIVPAETSYDNLVVAVDYLGGRPNDRRGR